jgi:flavodoxin I
VRALVIYDSAYGNTQRLAEAVAAVLEEFGCVRLLRAAETTASDVEGVELLIVGSPTQRRTITPGLRAFLQRVPAPAFGGLPTAVFDTRYALPRVLSGSAAHVLAKRLRARGALLLAPPECFLVTALPGPLQAGAIRHAQEWARTVAFAGRLLTSARFVRNARDERNADHLERETGYDELVQPG